MLVPPRPSEVVNPPRPAREDPYAASSRSNPTIIAPPGSADRTQDPTSAAAAVAAIRAGQTAPARNEPPTGLAPGVAASGQPDSEVLRYGPGVPPSQAGVSAEQVWRPGQMPDPPKRPVRVRRMASTLVTVILLIAAAVLLFLRFNHPAFHVTGTPTLSSTQNGCAVNVTGKIPTNGGSGTLSYQWVFTPQQEAPQPLGLSVVSGQHSVYVTVAVQGQGHGTATQKVTLQVLGPNQETASTVVTVSC